MFPCAIVPHAGVFAVAGENAENKFVCSLFSAVTVLHVHVNVNNLLATSKSDFDNSGEPGPQAKGVNHLETPLRQLQVTHRASSCAKRAIVFETQGGTRNRTQDLLQKGSAFITSSDHSTDVCVGSAGRLAAWALHECVGVTLPSFENALSCGMCLRSILILA